MTARIIFLTILLLSSAAHAEPLVGRASVVDGDTIEIAGERIRLNGIDAPESAQLCLDASGRDYRCGQMAATELDDWLTRSRPTRCEYIERDRYGRFVGQCFRADGAEVQDWLVREGHALDWPRYSDGAYAEAQDEAERAGRGIWGGEFTLPWEWRRGERLEAELAAVVTQQGAPSADCLIKGNISGNGRIYHSPGQEHYERTRIDEGDGERWFCSAEEAEAAGWRAARR